MIEIETERLIIRNFRHDDAEGLLAIVQTYQASEYAVYDQAWPSSAEAIQGVVKWFAEGDSFLAVCLKPQGPLIGCIAFQPGDDPAERVFDLGYVFNANFHGRGYASEACRAIIEYAFQSLGAERITAGTAAVNHPSRSLLARLGFRKTGQGQVAFQDDVQGKPIEFEGYSFELTPADWEQLAAGK